MQVDYLETKVNIINTHLSLLPQEQLLQVKTLLSSEWIKRPGLQEPFILCGDLNTSPNSAVYKEICKEFKDSQLMLTGHKPSKTWSSGLTFRRIDHIFVSSEFSVSSIQVPHTALDRLASDHLPIMVGLCLDQNPQLTKEYSYGRNSYAA